MRQGNVETKLHAFYTLTLNGMNNRFRFSARKKKHVTTWRDAELGPKQPTASLNVWQRDKVAAQSGRLFAYWGYGRTASVLHGHYRGSWWMAWIRF